MSKNTLKEYLGVDVKDKRYDLSLDACESKEANQKRIKQLFDIALEEDFILYFDGVAVDDPYDGLDLSDLKDEFYYNNGNSFLVFEDKDGFKVSFKIKYLKEYDYERVYKVTEKAVEYTKKHPEVSKYKLY